MATNLLSYGDAYGTSDNPLGKAPTPLYDPAVATQPDTGTPTYGAAVSSGVDALGQWLAAQRAKSRQMGLMDASGWPTQAGAVDAAQQFGNALLMGTTAPGDVPPPGILAYHGSPHSFDQFDASKIGTGEGAQAYGHGLYFAEKEGTAQQYRDQLAGKNAGFEWNGQPVPPGQPAYDLIDTLGNQDWRLGKIAEQAAKYGPRNAVDTFEPHTRNAPDGPEWQAAMDQFKQGAGKSATGSMYEVNIGADPQHFLDWDKPLSEQHPVVQDKLRAIGAVPDPAEVNTAGHFGYSLNEFKTLTPEYQRELIAKLPENHADYTRNARGSEIYHEGRDPVAAAQALQAAGIPGIRYLDQGSRGAGQGTHNYVVFDAATIDILRKYGIAGLIAGGGAAATQQGQPPNQ